MWYTEIHLKSGNNLIVDNLQSINKQNRADSSISKIKNFNEFHLSKGQMLTFVGDTIASLLSDEIEYIEFKQHD